jgi:hypothetical protein
MKIFFHNTTYGNAGMSTAVLQHPNKYQTIPSSKGLAKLFFLD